MKPSTTLLAIALCALAANACAAGDAVNGKLLYGVHCIACHSVDVGMAGPPHRGVFGRQAGAVPDYPYSRALKNSRVVWNETTLKLWLTNPEKLIPGQAMNYSVSDPKARADLVAYLKSLSSQSR